MTSWKLIPRYINRPLVSIESWTIGISLPFPNYWSLSANIQCGQEKQCEYTDHANFYGKMK
jgi:hypothetical protein